MTDVPLQTESAPPKMHSPLVRIGAYVLAGGFGVTTLGAVLLAQGQTSFEMAADFVHRFGMFSMLAGLGVLLFGYRWPMFKKMWRQIQESKMMQSQESGAVKAVAGPRLSGATTNTSVNTSLVTVATLVFVGLSLVACLLLYFAPLPLAVSVVVWVNLLLPAVLTVTLVQFRGYVRSFCIAALFPAGFALLSTVWQIGPLVMVASGGIGWSGGYGQELAWRMFVFIQWVLIIVLGAIGVGLHLFLDACRVSGGTRGDRNAR